MQARETREFQDQSPDSADQRRASRLRTIAFWTLTFPVVFEMVAGSLWALLKIEYVRVIMNHLGYPLNLLFILGVWKLAGAAAIIAPRFPRLKEWAYAGCFFNYAGAFVSHLLAGDGPDRWLPPLVFSAFVIASWALRPADRRLENARLVPETRPLAWAIPTGVLVLLLAISYLTLPSGPPPGY